MEHLERPAHRAHVEQLAREGLLDRAGADAAQAWIRGRIDWSGWLDRLLLSAGAALIACGIIYFFAYNWRSIPAFGKFALLEGGLAMGLLATWRVGLDCPTGKVMLTGCSVLVGVLLAVFGQVYQTGADEWTLFAGWAALIAGWAAIAEFAPLWMLLVGLLNLTVLLAERHFAGTWTSIALGLLNGAFLAAAEAGRSRGLEWLDAQWHRLVLWAAAIGFLTHPALSQVAFRYPHTGETAGFVLWLAALALGHAQYRARTPDVTALAIGAASVGFVALGFVSRNIVSGFFRFDADALLMSAFAAVIIAGALGAWLKAAAAQMQEVADV